MAYKTLVYTLYIILYVVSYVGYNAAMQAKDVQAFFERVASD